MATHKRRRTERQEMISHFERQTLPNAMNLWMVCLMLLATSPMVSSFSATISTRPSPNTALLMTYKPPVKRSVSKLRNSRFRSSSDRKKEMSKQQAAAGYVASPSHPPLQEEEVVSFQDRMRGLLSGDKQSQGTESRKPTRKLPPNVVIVDTLQEYKEVVGDETTQMVAVRFYAPFCKACKAVAPLFYHMANQFPSVKFVDVPANERNSNLHQGLGVPSVPYGHIYHPSGGLVEELRLTRKCVPGFARRLQSYVENSCDLQGVGDVTCPYPTSSQEE